MVKIPYEVLGENIPAFRRRDLHLVKSVFLMEMFFLSIFEFGEVGMFPLNFTVVY